MKNILILGVCGFIGSYLRRRLQPEFNIIGYDRIDPANVTAGDGFKYVCGDFATEDFYKLLRDNDIDTVFHLISSTVPIESTAMIENELMCDVMPTVRLLGDMAKSGTKRLIFASSGGAIYGELHGHANRTDDSLRPICSYGIVKAAIESYMSLFNNYHGLCCISARMGNPYGFWAQENRAQGIIPIFVKSLTGSGEITLFGDTKRDYIHIDDVTDALYKLISYRGEKCVFNIGSGQSHYLSEIVGIIEERSGKSFKSIKHESIRLCDVKESVLDVSETVSELDWSPKYDIYSGIDEILKQAR